MNTLDLLEAVKEYKEPKKLSILRIDFNRSRFRLIKNAKVREHEKVWRDKYYSMFQFQVRDISDGRFKTMFLPGSAFRELSAEINYLKDQGKNPLKFIFTMYKHGELMRTRYHVYSDRVRCKRKSRTRR